MGDTMEFGIVNYVKANGHSEIKELIDDLTKKAETSKDARIRLKKIGEYAGVLKKYGTRIGEPYIKSIRGDIWELRPTNDRIFFAYFKHNTFVLLHHIVKKTNKTPISAIEQAERNLKDWLERYGD